jgi:hypothetical protein
MGMRSESIVYSWKLTESRPQLSREAGRVNNLKDVRRGSRELKRLTCLINYDSDSAMSRGKSRAKGSSFVPMNLKIISWNVRGLNVRDKRLQVRHMLKLWNADIVCL